MSEYLKWYDSYLDHTPTEDLAKNELESAHRKIKHATEQLAKANKRAEELERQIEREKFKTEEFVRWVDRLIEEQKELRAERFRTFSNEEYLIFFDNGEDYPESMVAPVVMSADKFRELYYARQHNSTMQLVLMKVLDRWWPFVHGSTMPSETAKNIADEVRNAIEGKFK